MVFINKKNKVAHSLSCIFNCICIYVFFERMWKGNEAIFSSNTFDFIEDFFYSLVLDSFDYLFPSTINEISPERVRELRWHLKFIFYSYFLVAIVTHLLTSQLLNYTSLYSLAHLFFHDRNLPL